MSELSPAARATLDAVAALYDSDIPEDREIMIATLRAVVETYLEQGNGEGPQWFLAIADELETKYYELQ